jgi:hypothetical protein
MHKFKGKKLLKFSIKTKLNFNDFKHQASDLNSSSNYPQVEVYLNAPQKITIANYLYYNYTHNRQDLELWL